MSAPDTEMPRSERMELRATKREKALLSRAAAIEHLDVTSFVLRSALPEAPNIVDQHERVVLSECDTNFILDLLEHPPDPSPELVNAFRALQEHRIADDQ